MVFRTIFRLLLMIGGLVLCLQNVESATRSSSEQLSDLFTTYYEGVLERCPELATFVGRLGDRNGKWTDHSQEGYDQRKQFLYEISQQMEAIDLDSLSTEEKLNASLLKKDIQDQLEGYIHQFCFLAVDQLGGIPLDIENTMMMPKENLEDYHHILSRLSKIPELMKQTIDLLNRLLSKPNNQL